MLVPVRNLFCQSGHKFLWCIGNVYPPLQYLVLGPEPDLSIRNLYKTILRDWRPANVSACIEQKVLLRLKVIDIDHFESKKHFLLYAGRYVRRPPIAQYRFVKITDREVRFWTKDKILKRRVNVSYTPEEFVATLAEQVPNRYQHAIRYFGLLAPGSKARTSAALFLLLGQEKRPRPRRLSWAFSLRRDFGVDPLIDQRGQPMRWIGRLSPRAQEGCLTPAEIPPRAV